MLYFSLTEVLGDLIEIDKRRLVWRFLIFSKIIALKRAR